jgi:hypothetical protein
MMESMVNKSPNPSMVESMMNDIYMFVHLACSGVRMMQDPL